ncbi:MAG: lamin tail domain-containing protein [Kiritimatiellae bacterium]|jgi:hypothetical protein|nr:lamin tail domain-containing protein [Kiritimatiellia bacterium]
MKNIIYVTLTAVSIQILTASPLINEFMASNQSTYPDNCDFDDFSDWIELYNPTSTNIVLSNYFLTDRISEPFKWEIPGNPEIPAHGYLMFRADGFNAAPGEVYLRGFYPWGSTFTTQRYHTGFKLSAAGEEIALHYVDTPPADTNLIVAGSHLWRYYDNGDDPGAEWASAAYDDSTWGEGAGQFGYGDGDENTVVSYGSDSSHKYPATYFRTHFTIADVNRIGNIRFQIMADDGAVIYLNGVEAGRLRMDDGTVDYQTYASSVVFSSAEDEFVSIEIAADYFLSGDNVLAVEIHQCSGSSSDISFDAILTVSEVTGEAHLVDSLSFDQQLTDVSCGRNSESATGWSYFAEPSPEAANGTNALTLFAKSSAVTVSLPSGIYAGNDPLPVELSTADAGALIRFTLDGSVPVSGSLLYTNALTITDTTILRARSFATGAIPGEILSCTYLRGDDALSTLPVCSFVTDPKYLFDDTIGICENDSAYPYKSREMPLRVEFFEADQSSAFSVNAGIRIAGENIWLKDQKPFNIYCRSKYGDDQINYQVFPDEPVATFTELSFRNGGDDWEETMLRDAMMPSILSIYMNLDFYSYRPCILYLNGEFWGIYNIRKRFDETYFAAEHALEEDDIDFVQYAHNESGSTVLMAEIGDTETYESFKEYVSLNDPADPAIYEKIQDEMDIDSFIDYAVCTDFASNGSWSHNREFWKARSGKTKWRWVLNDFDRAFDLAVVNTTSGKIDDLISSYTLFGKLDNNTNFVNRLIQRYAAHLGSSFNAQRFSDQLDILTQEQANEIARHKARWPDSMTSYNSELQDIKDFVRIRPTRALPALTSELGLTCGMSDVTFLCSPAGAGTVSIAGVSMAPEYTNSVAVFEDTPVEFTASSHPGYQFDAWSNGDTNRAITLVLTDDLEITAIFIPSNETVLPERISADLVLSAANSPYCVATDLIVEANCTLTIEPGVHVFMNPHAGIRVYGALQANGSTAQPVEFLSRNGAYWGGIGFINATGESVISHAIVRDAARSWYDPLNLKAAVSGFNSSLILDNVDIVALQPVFARYGSTILRNSMIQILFTGDGINIKSGAGWVESSTFTGNDSVDTDAIDFDGVTDGLINGNRIYNFSGVNSDAIDVGEGCLNLLVISNRIYNVTDKGVSVGQASEAHIRRNLIVNCDMGVGIKDTGSTAFIDQNTFARVNTGVASYEKNEGNGGGSAIIENCIFSRIKDAPVFVDALSYLTVDYSLCDTLLISGTGNLYADPLFTDEISYDFSITSASPAVNSGNPAHALDADGSRADMGAYYSYASSDYPYFTPNLIVINEVLAHSHDSAPDWIELYNGSNQEVDLSDWYLSDNESIPEKYRIASETIIPAKGYIVFDQELHFGPAVSNACALIPFALSENGESVTLFRPGDTQNPDYITTEEFGASETGVSIGRYYKASTRTYNFVNMRDQTPGVANSEPLTGPIVISEIMYHPPVSDAEYIELSNISSTPITLYNAITASPWQFTDGIAHSFSSSSPVTMQSGEKIILARNSIIFLQNYNPPSGTQIIQWDSGALNNGGESVELSKPGDVDSLGVRQYIRVDRVNYSDAAPWPTSADGAGSALTKLNESEYGDDYSNWTALFPTPGQSEFGRWITDFGLTEGQSSLLDDPDNDGIPNIIEYAYGFSPRSAGDGSGYLANISGSEITFSLNVRHTDLEYRVQKTTDLQSGTWHEIPSSTVVNGETTEITAIDENKSGAGFYRLLFILNNYY